MFQDKKFNNFVTSVEEKFTPSDATILEAVDAIREALRQYVEFRNLQTLVVGLDGTLETTLVASLCQEQYTGVPLLGVLIDADDSNFKFKAKWTAKNYCTKFHRYDAMVDIQEKLLMIADQTNLIFDDYCDIDKTSIPEFTTPILRSLAIKTNGIVLGSKTWSDLCGTFLFQEGEADYYPLGAVNRGFELPAMGDVLKIPYGIIDTPSRNEKQIGASYKEVDVIINGLMGNLDANLSTQLGRFRTLGKVRRVEMRYNFNNTEHKRSGTSRLGIGLPLTYNF